MKSIQRKLGMLRDRIDRLEQMSRKIASFEEYQRSLDKNDIVERNLSPLRIAPRERREMRERREKTRGPYDCKGRQKI